MPDDYEIGYGKPPKEGQFQRGRSGNPKGRPKGSKNIATLVKKVGQEKISVKKNGRSQKMTCNEAVVRQILNRALSGDQRMTAEYLRLAREFESPVDLESGTPELHEREKSVFSNVLKRIHRMSEGTDQGETRNE